MRLARLLETVDCEGLRDLFQAFFASIPYEWHAARRCRRANNDIANYEGYYASVFYSYFAALGYEITVPTVEESTVEESTVWRRRARRSRSVRVDRRQRLPLRLWTVCGSRHMLIICRAMRNDMQRKRRVALACFGTGAIKRCGSLATWSLPPMRSSSTERTTVLSSSR